VDHTNTAYICVQILQTGCALSAGASQQDKVVYALQEDPLVLAPVAKEAVGSPPPGCLHNVGWGSGCKQLCCSANLEAVPHNTPKTEVCTNLLHLRKEESLGELPEHAVNCVTE
jgi:hypothetical protein